MNVIREAHHRNVELQEGMSVGPSVYLKNCVEKIGRKDASIS